MNKYVCQPIYTLEIKIPIAKIYGTTICRVYSIIFIN